MIAGTVSPAESARRMRWILIGEYQFSFRKTPATANGRGVRGLVFGEHPIVVSAEGRRLRPVVVSWIEGETNTQAIGLILKRLYARMYEPFRKAMPDPAL
jgi:hypothetical protein